MIFFIKYNNFNIILYYFELYNILRYKKVILKKMILEYFQTL